MRNKFIFECLHVVFILHCDNLYETNIKHKYIIFVRIFLLIASVFCLVLSITLCKLNNLIVKQIDINRFSQCVHFSSIIEKPIFRAALYMGDVYAVHVFEFMKQLGIIRCCVDFQYFADENHIL